jgi:hypothetical protein
MENIEEQYNKLKSKYKLPKFEDLDKEFEISVIENEKFLIREIINKIIERIDFFSKILEELLQPDTSLLSSMHETRFFDEKDKENIYGLYKKLMIISRESFEVSLKRDEREEAVFVNKVFDEWKELKKDLLKFVDKMKDSWKKETDIKEELGYLG